MFLFPERELEQKFRLQPAPRKILPLKIRFFNTSVWVQQLSNAPRTSNILKVFSSSPRINCSLKNYTAESLLLGSNAAKEE
jgi:hypothetical protein